MLDRLVKSRLFKHPLRAVQPENRTTSNPYSRDNRVLPSATFRSIATGSPSPLRRGGSQLRGAKIEALVQADFEIASEIAGARDLLPHSDRSDEIESAWFHLRQQNQTVTQSAWGYFSLAVSLAI